MSDIHNLPQVAVVRKYVKMNQEGILDTEI